MNMMIQRPNAQKQQQQQRKITWQQFNKQTNDDDNREKSVYILLGFISDFELATLHKIVMYSYTHTYYT